ncbi:MAG TPA: FAD-binding protein [Thermoanaerobaculia bacterium]|nr:FAD-binding protein [Thermoanaerobaculia bacterium]
MVCAAGSRGEEFTDRPWRNWAGNLNFRPSRTFRPTTLPELVAAVVFAEQNSMRVKAVGSSWSYSEAAVSGNVQVVVETQRLNRVLNGTTPTDGIVPGALSNFGATLAGQLLHVEAGIKIDELNCALDSRGLAMHTLGGERGQSLAGVISTGTHGSDFRLPPIADAVRAIHLVGPGGKEWWIEREGSRAITEQSRMEALRARGTLCADLSLIYDDRTFAAALVSVGRMGIVYSYVIEAVAAFRLRETREQTMWSTIEGLLRTPRTTEAPMALVARGSRFVEIVISPFRDSANDLPCVVTRRDIAPASAPIVPRAAEDQLFAMLCRQNDLAAILRPMLPLVDAAALGAFGLLLLVPFIGPGLFAAATGGYVALRIALQAVIDAAGTGANLGVLLARVCTAAAAVGQSWIVRDLVAMIVQQMRGPLPAPGFVLDQSFKVSTPQRDCQSFGVDSPPCMREIDGFEFAFNASPNSFGYVDFINDVAALVNTFLARNRPVGLALSLRYTAASSALIAMQQFPTNCMIEVMMLRGLPGNEEFVPQMEDLVIRHGGIAHWGLLNHNTAAQVRAYYGENLNTWRRVLLRFIDEGPSARTQTFSTTFSVNHDLEPMPGCRTLPPALANLLRIVLEAIARLGRRRG